MKSYISRLMYGRKLGSHEYRALLSCSGAMAAELRNAAVRTAQQRFGCAIFVRGLIEISSYCKNNCLYCGLRAGNDHAERYRLTESEILECCRQGYSAGLRTFVLQGGEDSWWSDERLVPLIEKISTKYRDAAITLSLGERSRESYKRLKEAGATRYLLRHEAANEQLYRDVHPANMSHKNRLEAIKALIDEGYQTGMGMMIGLPGQSVDNIVEDIELLALLRPQMVGIGPFIPHPRTPFMGHTAGDIELTLNTIAIVRLLLPNALIPATTALATLLDNGHHLAIKAGANVIMPNLSPVDVRSKYAIYAGKKASETEAVEGLKSLERELAEFGYTIDYGKGDYNDTL